MELKAVDHRNNDNTATIDTSIDSITYVGYTIYETKLLTLITNKKYSEEIQQVMSHLDGELYTRRQCQLTPI